MVMLEANNNHNEEFDENNFSAIGLLYFLGCFEPTEQLIQTVEVFLYELRNKEEKRICSDVYHNSKL